jgi:hypothetical protein
MNATNDTQLTLVEQLTNLNEQLNLFINGDADTIVVTDSGPIKSIAGIVRDLTKFRYVQKVIDHRLYSDMVADDLNLEDGLLIRVWGDTEANGLYKKLGALDYAKVSYTDLYDLGSIPA